MLRMAGESEEDDDVLEVDGAILEVTDGSSWRGLIGRSCKPLKLGRFGGTLPLSVLWISPKAPVKCCNSAPVSFNL